MLHRPHRQTEWAGSLQLSSTKANAAAHRQQRTSEMKGFTLLRAFWELSLTARCASTAPLPLPSAGAGCLLPAGGTPSSCRR